MSAERIANALHFAMAAHAGQVYETADGPEPYVLHPIRVALAVQPECMVVALLHDVVEDTDAVLPGWLTEVEHLALMLLTRPDNVEYADYIDDIATAASAAGAIARAVKRADLLDNLHHIRPGHRESLRPRYRKALAKLEGATP